MASVGARFRQVSRNEAGLGVASVGARFRQVSAASEVNGRSESMAGLVDVGASQESGKCKSGGEQWEIAHCGQIRQ